MRRTQRERSETTQARLLEATVEVLAEVGWARLTTAAICERAGLTRGAQLHHFPTKAALVNAAVRRLTERVLSGFDEGLDAIWPEGDPLAQFLEGVWRTLDGPLFEVGLELLVAARSDPDLRRALEPATAELRAATEVRVRRVAAALHPAHPGALEPVLHLSVHLVHAFALDRVVSPRPERSRALFEAWSEVVRRLVAHEG